MATTPLGDLQDVKDFAIEPIDNEADEVLDRVTLVATDIIQGPQDQGGTGIIFQSGQRTEVYDGDDADGRDREILYLRNHPILTATLPVVVEDDQTLTVGLTYDSSGATDVLVYPDLGDGYLVREPTGFRIRSRTTSVGWAAGRRNIQVTYSSGYSSIPDDVYQAWIELCWLLFKESRNVGIGGVSTGGHNAEILRELSPLSKATLERYRMKGRPA